MKATVIHEVSLPAARLWAVIEDFGNISWAPGIERVEIIGSGIGMIRRLHMPGLPEPIDEQLLSMDAASMKMHYAIPRGLPMPLDDYTARAHLEKLSDTQTRITWEGDFIPRGISENDAGAIIKDIYNQLIGWIIDRVKSTA
jgi:carbon monoxide dehydrogenase subunit G